MHLLPAKGGTSKEAIREKCGSNFVFGAGNGGHQTQNSSTGTVPL